jgi:ABC-2 type transport system permease protein
MRNITGAIVAVVVREFTRFLRQHGRLVSTFARPLLWLVVVGAGFERIVPTAGTVSYLQFLLPGIFGMVLLFSTMLSALATVHDREFGPIRMLLVAPLPRWVAVVAKTISSTLIGVFQAVVLLPLIWILGLHPSLLQVLELLGGVVLLALALSSLGMVIASRLRSIENFAGVMNFLMFPMFFLSSALYPAEMLPKFLHPFVRADPLTYGIDLMRDALLSGLYVGNFGSDYTASFDITVLVCITLVLFALAALLFGEEEHLGRILLVEKPRTGSKTSWAKSALEQVQVRRPPGPRPQAPDEDKSGGIDEPTVGAEA